MSLNTEQASMEFNKMLQNGSDTISVQSMNLIKKIIESDQITNKSNHKVHKTIKILNPFHGNKVDVDVDVAKLVKYMWICGIRTTNTCSCNESIPRDYVWIEFLDTESMKKFMSIVFTGIPNTSNIFSRANKLTEINEGSWIYDLTLMDDNPTTRGFDIKDVYTFISVRFPKSDYEWICKRFEKNIKDNYTCTLF
ncbi:hypothetical protein QJ850_gp539 [Acanthamoeba polyphaga mimivirus]|uniref:Uncharacterized protein n=1 Tax=Acanthamoeba polyphaga mimivirus Kroon TaxID=3069720 RepID=A0A0G2Y318_9VIRU|nr:hypothetical protein QJ850_gp539 [Acanthamoeba polyphaga mimivirus]AKI80160.1 hypothetical protein [Acanthamoeba polyphaga mimivirus Kroon]